MAPLEFIGRYLPDWFDYGICDEAHQLKRVIRHKGMGSEPSPVASTVLVVLTGTLLEWVC